MMVVTTDGMAKNLLSLLVEMLESGAPGWDSGGEILLLSADGGCELRFDGCELWLDGAVGADGSIDAR